MNTSNFCRLPATLSLPTVATADSNRGWGRCESDGRGGHSRSTRWLLSRHLPNEQRLLQNNSNSYHPFCVATLNPTLKGLHCLCFVSSLILGVHRNKAKHQQIKRSGNNRQAKENENKSEQNVFRSSIERIIFLQCNHVAESDGC